MELGEVVKVLIGDLAWERFVEDVWGRSSLLTRGQLEDRPLLSLDELELAIGQMAPSDSGSLRVLRDGKPRPLLRDSEKLINVASVLQAVHEGFSLSLSRVHRRVDRVGRRCRELEFMLRDEGLALRRPIDAVAYATPPSSRSFGGHYDNHDFFAVQCEGTKHWVLYDQIEPHPINHQYGPSQRELTIREEFLLEPGDALYVPRGMYHEARTTESLSLHVSLCMYPMTWADFVRQLAEGESELGQSVPRHFLSEPNPSPAGLGENLQRVVSAVHLGHTMDRLRQIATESCFISGGRLQSAARLKGFNLESVVYSDLSSEVVIERTSDSQLMLVVSNVPTVFGAEVEVGVRFATSQVGPFRVLDIPADSDTSRLTLARELVRCGILNIATPA